VHAADPPAPAASAAARPAAGTLADAASPSAPAAAGPPLLAVGMRRPPRTAFVLAGGAGLGAIQAGMLRARYERGVRPDLLVGTSAGALNAAYIAARPQTVQTAKALADVWRGLRREDVFPIHPPTLIAGLSSHGDHLVPGRPLRELISRHLQLERLEDAAVPLHVVTFDLLSGHEVRLSEGPALGAVLAAAAIPGVFPPVRWGERLLVDGGTVNNTPISHAVALGARRIFVLPIQDLSDRRLSRPARGALESAVHAFALLANARLEADLARYRFDAELIVLPAPNRSHVLPTDFNQADRLIAGALQASRVVLGELFVSEQAAA
jgi:NTE family protein